MVVHPGLVFGVSVPVHPLPELLPQCLDVLPLVPAFQDVLSGLGILEGSVDAHLKSFAFYPVHGWSVD